jgi:hypothetical protein
MVDGVGCDKWGRDDDEQQLDEARVRRMVAGEIGVDLGALLEGGKVGLAVLRQALAAAEAKATGFAVHDATAKP